MKSPLLLSAPLPDLVPDLLAIINNTELIAVNQDSAGVQVDLRTMVLASTQTCLREGALGGWEGPCGQTDGCTTPPVLCVDCDLSLIRLVCMTDCACQARKLAVNSDPLPWLVGLAPCDLAPKRFYSRGFEQAGAFGQALLIHLP